MRPRGSEGGTAGCPAGVAGYTARPGSGSPPLALGARRCASLRPEVAPPGLLFGIGRRAYPPTRLHPADPVGSPKGRVGIGFTRPGTRPRSRPPGGPALRSSLVCPSAPPPEVPGCGTLSAPLRLAARTRRPPSGLGNTPAATRPAQTTDSVRRPVAARSPPAPRARPRRATVHSYKGRGKSKGDRDLAGGGGVFAGGIREAAAGGIREESGGKAGGGSGPRGFEARLRLGEDPVAVAPPSEQEG